MKDSKYETALWGFSWDEAIDSGEQGIANLADDDLVLDIPFGQLLSFPGDIVIGAGEQPPEQADALYGFSQDGYYLLLQDVFLIGGQEKFPGGKSQIIRGDRLFASRKPFDIKGGVVRATLGFTGLREWVGETMLVSKYDKEPFRFRSVELDFDALKASEEPVYVGKDCSICIVHSLKVPRPNTAGMSISHDCTLVVEFVQRTSTEEVISLALSLANFLTLCAGRSVQVASIRLGMESGASVVDLHVPLRFKPVTRKFAEQAMPFPYQRVKGMLGTLLAAWFGLEEGAANVATLTASLVADSWALPSELRFLSAAQALEAFARVGADIQAMNPSAHARCRELALSAVEDDGLHEWLAQSFPGNHRGQRRLLREFCERNAELVGAIVPDAAAFVRRHADERNRYTHRATSALRSSGNLEEPGQLHWHTEAVILICYGFLWSLLGIQASEFIEALKHTNYRQEVMRHLREGA